MYAPWSNRRVGIEMEVSDTTRIQTTSTSVSLRSVVQRAIDRAGAQAGGGLGGSSGYFHSTGNTWDVKTDASCGFEICSPAITLNGEGHHVGLRTVCEELNGYGAKADHRCGLHVHVEASDYDWQDVQRLLAWWSRYEPFFYEITAQTRRTSHFCSPVRSDKWDNARGNEWSLVRQGIAASTADQFRSILANPDNNSRGLQRRHSLNINPWWRNGRVEFRLWAGTIDYNTVRRYAMLCAAIVSAVKQPRLGGVQVWSRPGQPMDTYYVFSVLGLTKATVPDGEQVSPAAIDLFDWTHARRLSYVPNAPRNRHQRRAEQVGRPVRPHLTPHTAPIVNQSAARVQQARGQPVAPDPDPVLNAYVTPEQAQQYADARNAAIDWPANEHIDRASIISRRNRTGTDNRVITTLTLRTTGEIPRPGLRVSVPAGRTSGAFTGTVLDLTRRVADYVVRIRHD